MTEAQIQLQNALTTTFLANLAFLSEYDNTLYHRVDELSRMINNGSYQEKYILEFIETDGDFDIYDNVNDKYLYNKKPKNFNKNLISQINFDENNCINTMEKALYDNILENINEEIIIEKRYNLQDSDDSEVILKYDVSRYLKVLKDKKKEQKLIKIDKFIFFGTLCGRHINPIVEKINASLYFVCEKNLELFRLSLFVNDYSHLTNKEGVIFSIMDKEEEFRNKAKQFLDNNSLANYLIKISSTNINVHEYIDIFLTQIIIDNKPTTFDYNRMLYTLMRNVSEKVNNEDFLQFEENKLINILNNTPILYVAAGPSFQKNLQWIKNNQNKFVIVALGATYKILINNNIKVDIVITLDGSYRILKEKQFSDDDLKLLKNSIVLYSSMTDKRFVNFFPKNKFVYDVVNSYYNKTKMLPATSVGEKGIELLLRMGAREIYLLGLDLSLDQETGNTHSSLSNSASEKYDLNNMDIYDRSIFGLNTGLIKVKGNFINEVLTTSLLKSSIECLNSILNTLVDTNIKIYNLSKSGAFIDNTIPCEIDKVNLKEINLDINDLISIFKSNSKKFLSIEAKNNIKFEVKYIKNDIFKLLKEYEETNYNTYDEFFDCIVNLIDKLIYDNNKITFLHFILDNYFQIVLKYLNYKFNRQKYKNEYRDLQKVKILFFQDIERLLKDYAVFLRNMVKPKLKT